ncbi:MAG: lipase family protein [Pseudomonadota bacterium]
MGNESVDYGMINTPFAPKAEGLNLNNALYLAAASKLAYEDDASTIRQVLGQWGFDQFQDFRWQGKIETEGLDVLADTYGYVCSNPDALVIVFRGTQFDNIRNWLTDAMIRTTPLPNGAGSVHKGFWAAFKSAWPEIKVAIGTQHVIKQPVWITGHSLGGALAAMCAAHLRWTANTEIQGLYTFGQPRVGNYTFATQFSKDLKNRCIRFVNNNDIVPHLPPPGPILRYRHIDGLMYIDADGKLHAKLPWWKRLVDMGRGAIQDAGRLGPDLLKDHAIGLYAEHIKRLT